MTLSINTNINSLTAQNNLSKSQSALSQATARLSSGLKINSASDNAAGYAISTNFTTQIGGLGQASSNASDAINLAQTTQSALSQVTANLQAIRDLAVQSANGSYTNADRASINTEVQQRLAEVTRIANQTDFNGQKVLDGSLGTLSFQVGANVGQTISVNVHQGVKASQLGAVSSVSTGDLSGVFTPDPTTGGGTPKTLDLSKITITGTDGVPTVLAISGAPGSTVGSVQDLADAINAKGIAGVTAAVDGKGGINLFSTGELNIADAGSVSGLSTSGKAGVTTIDSLATQSGSATAGGVPANGAFVDGTAVYAAGSLQGGDVTSVGNSNTLISRIDVALNTVSNLNSNLGAIQNRFESTISTLSAQKDNLASSKSTIQDADFAAETANLSKANILQQAGISVLAQANSQPQQVLKLLQ